MSQEEQSYKLLPKSVESIQHPMATKQPQVSIDQGWASCHKSTKQAPVIEYCSNFNELQCSIPLSQGHQMSTFLVSHLNNANSNSLSTLGHRASVQQGSCTKAYS